MMSSNQACRVVIEAEPHDGAWNMAVDEALLEAAVEHNECAVRVYKWSRATMSLGYFQKEIPRPTIPGADALPVVRRLSGGGAILHHHELTYSCAVPPKHPLSRVPGELYGLVHNAIIATLSLHGIDAHLRATEQRLEDEPFLCFGRADPTDVVYQRQKILGSAQRRRRGAILQHGSLLLEQSPWAPQFPGVQDLAPDFTFGNRNEISLACAIGKLFHEKPLFNALTERVRKRATELEQRRYRSLDWTRRP